MSLIRLSPGATPGATPLAFGLTDMLRWVREDAGIADADLLELGRAVEEVFQRDWGFHGYALLTQQWRWTRAAFPIEGKGWWVPVPPLRSVDSITYFDGDNALQTLSTDVYDVVPSQNADGTDVGRIMLAYGQSWPTVYQRPEAIRITFTAGFTSADLVPMRILRGMGYFIAAWYAQRSLLSEGALVEVPDTALRLWAPYRFPVFGGAP